MAPKLATRRTPAAINARAAEIKRLQEEALSRLPLNTIYIVLWLRSDPPRPNDFHWGYYFHTTPQGGMKYHIRNIGAGWMTDFGFTGGVFKSNFLCVLVQVATVPETSNSLIDQIMRSYDAELNSIPGITCRVWLLKIMEKLIEHGLVQCNNLDALQEECMSFGNQFSEAAIDNEQPRPVVKSRFYS